jgi:nitrate/nitrite-specific signal transduction histidine kinase
MTTGLTDNDGTKHPGAQQQNSLVTVGSCAKNFLRRFGRGNNSIRKRLLSWFILLSLIPALGINVGTILVSYYNGKDQALERIESVTSLKEMKIRDLLNSIRNEISVTLSEQFALERVSIVLDLAQADQYYSFYSGAMRVRLQLYTQRSHLLEEILVTDPAGMIVLSTEADHEGEPLSHPVEAKYQLNPSDNIAYYSLGDLAGGSLWIWYPILNQTGQFIGYLVGRADLSHLMAILEDRTGLGQTGKTILVGPDRQSLYGPSTSSGTSIGTTHPDQHRLDTPAVRAVLSTQAKGSGIYEDAQGTRVLGVYHWMPELAQGLIVEQDLLEAFRLILTSLAAIMGSTLLVVMLAGTLLLRMTHTIADPITKLSRTATLIAAGDLEQTASEDSIDEVGMLASAFNSMTAQLRELINGLEHRVAERTSDLQKANNALRHQALQLETSAQIGREVTSILHINDLLSRVVGLIRDAFGYHQVMIYLVDKEANRLVLKASTESAIVPRRHLDISESHVNGSAVLNHSALLINDTSTDPRFISDERLPETRAELVIPLRVGETVVGTLDVHGLQTDAFTPEDMRVIQSLGDQIAVSIENARLYERSWELAVIEERNRLARELHDSISQSLYSLGLITESNRRRASTQGEISSSQGFEQIGEITQQMLKEMRLLVFELRPPVLEKQGLAGALQHRLETVEKRTGVNARLMVDGIIHLQAAIEEGLYRIALEALNNALKHASAETISIQITAGEGLVTLTIRDDGKGFNHQTVHPGGGMGLSIMRERAWQMGGTIEILSSPGHGTVVRVSVEIDPSIKDQGQMTREIKI